MNIINHTPWDMTKLQAIAQRVLAKERDASKRQITTIIFAPQGARVRLHGMLDLGEMLGEIIVRVYLEAPEELRRRGTGFCRRPDCHGAYRFHDDADHAFEPVPVALCLEGRRVAFNVALAIRRYLGRPERWTMNLKYLDMHPWAWAPDVPLDGEGVNTAAAQSDAHRAQPRRSRKGTR